MLYKNQQLIAFFEKRRRKQKYIFAVYCMLLFYLYIELHRNRPISNHTMNALPLLTYLAINPLKRKRFQKFFQLKTYHGARVDMQQAYEIKHR